MSAFDAEAQAQVLEAQIAAAKAAPDYAVFKSGDEDLDAALVNGGIGVAASLADDRRTLYHIATGEPVEVPVALLSKTLMKRRQGKAAFSTTKPSGVEYRQGDVMCFLHPDHPGYADLHKIGLANRVCGGGETPPAAHLASEYDRDQHMQRRHHREWEVMERNRERLEREEQNRMQREQLDAMRSIAGVAAGKKAG